MAREGTIRDRRSFITANTRPLPVPHAPEISLHLADEVTPLWLKTEEELGAMGLPPPFWAFAWAGGQALARYILDHPDHVAGRRVLDFASGSGLVAVAAMKAGAAQALAVDIDEFAVEAIKLNAELNGVAIEPCGENVLGRYDWPAEIILAGDIFYDREISAEVLAWLRGWRERGAAILVGDPGRTYLPKDELSLLATYQVPVSRDLEDLEIKKTSVWTLK
ncbi:methyltransferase [Labrys sp. KNU-23]|uniref:class I SAM-dependent methyltransferase n=1 Tax=Labrys sp. KNU-23 TaxID=2789216 RepID=UPI0011ED166B|nr:methyltransferase [Labrys sp. KNU-23]QEN89414.1 methyltransferase [Labrys sp. KNU-23]